MTDSETELPAPSIQDVVSKARHPPVIEMVRSAIAATEDRKGATVPSIKKWISVNYPEIDQNRLKTWLRINLKKGLESGEFIRPKNSESAASVMLGRYKLGKDPKKAKTAKKLALKKKMKKKALVTKGKGEDGDDEAEGPTTPAKRARPKKKVISRSHSLSPKVRTSKSKKLRRSLSMTPAKVVLKKVKAQKATLKKSPAKKSTKKSKAEDSPKKTSKKKSEKTSKTGKKAKATDKKDKPDKKTKKETNTKSKPKEKNAAAAAKA